jgi:hypothetical protein
MSSIRVSTVGKIVAGDELGWYVRVDEDFENTGGYLILTSKTPDMRQCFDNWVKNIEDLKEYFDEAKWTVEWL